MGTLNLIVPGALLRLFSFEICPNYIIRASCFSLWLAAVSSHHQSVALCGRPPLSVVHRGDVQLMNNDSTLYLFLM